MTGLGRGRIVLVASVNGRFGGSALSGPAYAASKGGLLTLGRFLAREHAAVRHHGELGRAGPARHPDVDGPRRRPPSVDPRDAPGWRRTGRPRRPRGHDRPPVLARGALHQRRDDRHQRRAVDGLGTGRRNSSRNGNRCAVGADRVTVDRARRPRQPSVGEASAPRATRRRPERSRSAAPGLEVRSEPVAHGRGPSLARGDASAAGARLRAGPARRGHDARADPGLADEPEPAPRGRSPVDVVVLAVRSRSTTPSSCSKTPRRCDRLAHRADRHSGEARPALPSPLRACAIGSASARQHRSLLGPVRVG